MFEDLLAREPEVAGVVRLVIERSFDAPLFHTFIYTPDVVIAGAFVRGYGLWDVVPLHPGGEANPTLIGRAYLSLSIGLAAFRSLARSRGTVVGVCPEVINEWGRVRRFAEQAVDCWAPVEDGDIYRHGLRDREGVLVATWANPGQEYGFPTQALLVEAYARLLATARLTPHLIRQTMPLEDREVKAEDEPPPDEDDENSGRSARKRSKPWQRRQ